jgi:hypothetical protein
MDVGLRVDQYLNKFILKSLLIVVESSPNRLEAGLISNAGRLTVAFAEVTLLS